MHLNWRLILEDVMDQAGFLPLMDCQGVKFFTQNPAKEGTGLFAIEQALPDDHLGIKDIFRREVLAKPRGEFLFIPVYSGRRSRKENGISRVKRK